MTAVPPYVKNNWANKSVEGQIRNVYVIFLCQSQKNSHKMAAGTDEIETALQVDVRQQTYNHYL